MPIKSRIRTIPDHPKPGIQFRDITTLLQDPIGLRLAVDGLADAFRDCAIDKVAGIEARGFIIGAAVAKELGKGFVLLRKAGKLPYQTLGFDYELEYGTDRIEAHVDAVSPGERVLLVDDLVATGGTCEAAIRVLEALGGEVVGVAAVVDLPDVGGRRRIEALGHKLVALCAYEGD
ncbi:MAG: adenine phosphoribosyltransferase [Deltaproteobacteria bacterium]|nr:adenine phosphoribosyltransferase [Deltaproteobacteria bacterium]MBW2361592.1 adenine phosphoribosyltransferase [Deltaproteobacteria bacterium]